ncbi:MAG: SRPBCC family protein [Parvibaculaceae bacterium]
MEIKQDIHVSRSPDEVWAFLGDVPTVVSCIPGAELGASLGGNRYGGSFKIKVGPLAAKVEGEGEVERDDAARTGRIVGRGIDKRGGSRVAVTMDYAVVPDGTGSLITVKADTDLSGPLAQIGRTGIIEDVARRLTEEFAAALETRLSARPSSASGQSPAATTESVPPPDVGTFDAGRAVSAGLRARVVAFLRRLLGIR